jgi:hypothetical protein
MTTRRERRTVRLAKARRKRIVKKLVREMAEAIKNKVSAELETTH